MLPEVGVSGSALGPRAGSSHQASNDLTACSLVIASGERCGVARGRAFPDFMHPVGMKRGADMAAWTRGSP